jgi:hypothetical protein
MKGKRFKFLVVFAVLMSTTTVYAYKKDLLKINDVSKKVFDITYNNVRQINNTSNTNNVSPNMSPQSLNTQSPTNPTRSTTTNSNHPTTNSTANQDVPEENSSLNSTTTNTNPQGVTNITTLESPTSEDDPNAGVRAGLAISTAVATTTAGLLLVFARRNKDDDEGEENNS